MNSPGDSEVDLLVKSRSTLLDALQALDSHREAIIVIGAQALYLRASSAPVALAEATKDSDLALDPRALGVDPLIENTMRDADFLPNLESGQPGSWINTNGIPVDLMVPEKLAGPGPKDARGTRLPPHDRRAMRRAVGLEASMVDNDVRDIPSLDPSDTRRLRARVAGSAALIIAKTHKIAERSETPHRLSDKDAHDLYRLLLSTETDVLAATFCRLLQEDVCSAVTESSLLQLRDLFAVGPQALGSLMAGRAEEGVGEPETVSLQVSILSEDLLRSVERMR